MHTLSTSAMRSFQITLLGRLCLTVSILHASAQSTSGPRHEWWPSPTHLALRLTLFQRDSRLHEFTTMPFKHHFPTLFERLYEAGNRVASPSLSDRIPGTQFYFILNDDDDANVTR